MRSSELFTLSFLAVVLMRHQALSESYDVTPRHEYGFTEMKAERIIYDWTIRDFDRFNLKRGEYINSTVFGSQNEDKEWRLELYPKGINAKANGWVSLYLQPHSHKATADDMNTRVECKLSLVVPDVQQHIFREFERAYADKGGYGFLQFIERSQLLGLTGFGALPFHIRADINITPRIITGAMEEVYAGTQKYPD